MQTLLKPIRVCVADPQPIMRSALKACLRTTEGIHVTELLGSWSDLAQYLSANTTDVVVIDQSLLDLTEVSRLQSKSNAAWLVLTHHQAEADSLRATGIFQAFLNKDAGVSELTRTVQNLAQPAQTNAAPVSPSQPAKAAKKTAPKTKIATKAATKPAAKAAKSQKGDSTSAANLTPREQEVATLLGQGLSLEAIAEKIGVQLKTVKTYQTNLKKKNRA